MASDQVFIAGPGARLPRPGPREPGIVAENPRSRPQLWPKQYPEGTRASRCPPLLRDSRCRPACGGVGNRCWHKNRTGD